jgi:hypothetical protein
MLSYGVKGGARSLVLLDWWLLLGKAELGAAIVMIVDLEVNATKGAASELLQFLAEGGLAATLVEVQPAKQVVARGAHG